MTSADVSVEVARLLPGPEHPAEDRVKRRRLFSITDLGSDSFSVHGIVVLGGLLLIGPAATARSTPTRCWSSPSPSARSTSLGGFLVTDRMLGMFKGRKPDPVKETQGEAGDERSEAGMSRADVIQLLYIVAFGFLHHGPCRCCAAPRTAVRGQPVAATGMAIAVIATLISEGVAQPA